jgi:hypothetical protein
MYGVTRPCVGILSLLQARASEHYNTIQNIVYISKSIYEVLILWDGDRGDSDYGLLQNSRIIYTTEKHSNHLSSFLL